MADKNKQYHKKRCCYVKLLAAMALPITLRMSEQTNKAEVAKHFVVFFAVFFFFFQKGANCIWRHQLTYLALYLCNTISCAICLKKEGVQAAWVEQPDMLHAAGSPIYAEKPVEGGPGEPVQQEPVTKGPIHRKTHRKHGNHPPDLQMAAATICRGWCKPDGQAWFHSWPCCEPEVGWTRDLQRPLPTWTALSPLNTCL